MTEGLPNLAPEQIQETMERAEKERIERNKDLESRAKQLHELVVTEKFVITEAIGQDYPTSFTPSTEMIPSRTPPVYSGGFVSKLVLEVLPDDKDSPIRTLIFDGSDEVKAGDYIAAQIPRYKEERIDMGFSLNPQEQESIFYVPRDFTAEENAIEIALLSPGGKVLRRKRSSKYDNFTKTKTL